MKWLISKLAPGVIVTIAAVILSGVFSRAADPKTVVAVPAPIQDPRYQAQQPQPANYSSDRCNQCGARVSADGRAIQFAERDERRELAPQVIYVVHLNGGEVQDLRAWPQPIFPAARFALPIPERCAVPPPQAVCYSR